MDRAETDLHVCGGGVCWVPLPWVSLMTHCHVTEWGQHGPGSSPVFLFAVRAAWRDGDPGKHRLEGYLVLECGFLMDFFDSVKYSRWRFSAVSSHRSRGAIRPLTARRLSPGTQQCHLPPSVRAPAWPQPGSGSPEGQARHTHSRLRLRTHRWNLESSRSLP